MAKQVPVRLLILQKLSELLAAKYGFDHNGDEFDFTEAVYRGRTEFGADTDLPAISIIEAPRTGFQTYAGEDKEAAIERGWPLLVQAWAPDDAENPTDPCYYLSAAICQRLALVVKKQNNGTSTMRKAPTNEFFLFGNLISSFEFGPPIVRPADGKSSSKAFLYVPVRITLAGEVSETYRQIDTPD
jgi:hypothetical protein